MASMAYLLDISYGIVTVSFLVVIFTEGGDGSNEQFIWSLDRNRRRCHLSCSVSAASRRG